MTLNGFKSFADPTEFRFDAAITGIVGPNGCGKSNVVDAVKWVLGERSAKSLRGKEMADVIFAGSAGRSPKGMASVSLVFENPTLTEDELRRIEEGRKIRRLAEDDSQPEPPQLESQPESQPEAQPEDNTEQNAEPADEHPTTETPPRDDTAATNAPAEPIDVEDHLHDDDKARDIGIDRAHRRRLLPIDTEEVEVERRLYRDGKSQYLINGRLARLKDIRELFLDTGVGADAYSIIEQGKVDAMLLANPVERRTFFEEAAGISRFKARRLEAQRKLERTEVNLVRTREQLENAERRLRMVRGQAAKARRFQELDEEYNALRLAVLFDQYDELRRGRIDLDAETAAIEDERARAIEAVEALDSEKQDAELARHELQRAREERRHEADAATQRRASAEQRLEVAERGLAEAERQAESEKQRATELRERIQRLEHEADEQRQLIAELEASRERAERDLTTQAQARERAQGGLADLRMAAGRARASASALDRERAQAATRIEADERRMAGLTEQTAALAERLADRRHERENAEEAVRLASDEVDDLNETILELQRNLEAKVASASSLSDDQRDMATALNTLEQEATRLDGRRQTLEEMAAERVGLAESVRAVLAKRDELAASDNPTQSPGLYNSIVAPLAELIRVEARDAPAVEGALGAALQAIVVNGSADVIGSADLGDLPGRVMFVAGDSSGTEPTDLASTERSWRDGFDPGSIWLRPVSELVECDEPARRVIDRLLGATFLVESLDSAMLLAAGPMRGARFVTRSGEVLEADGRVVAGPIGAGEGDGGGLLQRASELERLRGEVANLHTRIDASRTDLRAVDERAGQLDEAMGELRSILADRERRLVSAESARDRAESEAGRLEREITSLEEDHAEADHRVRTLATEGDELRESMERLASRFAEVDAEASRLEAEVETRTAEAEELAEALSHARVTAKQAEERFASAQREERRITRQLDDARDELNRAQAAIENRASRADEERAVIDEAKTQIANASDEAENAKAAASELTDELAKASDRAFAVAERLAEAREHAAEFNQSWNRLELQKRENEIHTENLEKRAADELAVNLYREYPDYRETMAGGEVEPIERAGTSTRIEELRKEIRKLGNVNLDAIGEENELEERNESLIEQVADIDRAREQLEILIARLSEVSRERFKEAFETIRDNFSGPKGMFRRLFGGGRAEVDLIPDPETGEIDWLESGVQVTAKPPGKDPRSINQLSGGEKTMTAVAMLLSIFESKPSPFCILDEVDAALDDANVERYGAIIRQFLDRCHFIVITHNKRTMQVADVLYGVTMQERGVSKRVAVRFDDVAEGGTINTKPATTVEAMPASDDDHDEPTTGRTRFSDALREDAGVGV